MRTWALIAASCATLALASSCAKLGDNSGVPPPKERAYAQIGDLRMYYEVYGEGSPLVLLHGGGSTIRESWAEQLTYFAPTHRIIAPEQQGHGQTPDLDRPLSYVNMAEDTAQLLTKLGIQNADVLGWSDGGIIGLYLAAHHPELVRRLVVSGANIDPSGLESETPRDSAAPAGNGPAAGRDARPTAEPQEHRSPFEVKLAELWSHHPTPAELSVEDLAKIQAPTLVVAGDHDAIRLDHTVMIYRSIPHAELLVLPGTSHNTFGQRATWLNPIVAEFLNKPMDVQRAAP